MPTPFEILVERVRILDPDAATYLENSCEGDDCSFSKAYDIDVCMIWAGTRQGAEFWRTLSHKLFTNQDIPKLPTKQRVSNKCKKLWNNSNWVKQHPSQAY